MAVAAFDFDGTLTRRDTILPFLWAVRGTPGMLAGLPMALPHVAGRAARLVDATTTKERLFGIYLAGLPFEQVRAACEVFARHTLPGLLCPKAMARLAWHRERGDRCVVVTASPDVYIAPWARATGLDLIASRLEVADDGRMTGRHAGPVCEFGEKARRLQAHIGPGAGPLFAYGDSAADADMLRLARFPYFRVMPRPGDA